MSAVRSPEKHMRAPPMRGARQEGPCGRRAAATRWKAAACSSWRAPGAVRKDWLAERRTRARAALVSQGVAGNARRHASLPCLDRKISWLAPLVVSLESLVARGAVVCAVEDSKLVSNFLASIR